MNIYVHSGKNSVDDGIEYLVKEVVDEQCTYINAINPKKVIDLIKLHKKDSLLKLIDYRRINQLAEIIQIFDEVPANSLVVIEDLIHILSQTNADYSTINVQLIDMVKSSRRRKLKLYIIDSVKNLYIDNLVDDDIQV